MGFDEWYKKKKEGEGSSEEGLSSSSSSSDSSSTSSFDEWVKKRKAKTYSDYFSSGKINEDIDFVNAALNRAYGSAWQSQDALASSKKNIDAAIRRITDANNYLARDSEAWDMRESLGSILDEYKKYTDTWDENAKRFSKYSSAIEWDKAVAENKKAQELRDKRLNYNLEELYAENEKWDAEHGVSRDSETGKLSNSTDAQGLAGLSKEEFDAIEQEYGSYAQYLSARKGVAQSNLEESMNRWREYNIASDIQTVPNMEKEARSDVDFDTYRALGAADHTENNMVELMRDSNARSAFYSTLAEEEESGSIIGWDPYVKDMQFSEMTDDEVAVYDYYIGKGDSESARKYLEALNEDLNYRVGQGIAESSEGDLAFELAFQIAAGLDQFNSGVANFGRMITGKESKDTSIVGAANQYIMSDVESQGKFAQWAAQAISTSVNMLPSQAAGALVGAITENPKAAEWVSTGLMSVTAMGNTYKELYEQGYNTDYAVKWSIIDGLWEGLSEHWLGSIEGIAGNAISKKLFGDALEQAKKNAFVRIGSFLVDIGQEGAEEVIQDIGSSVLQAFTDELYGLKAEIDIPNFDELFDEFIVGMGSALLMNGTTRAIGGSVNRASANAQYRGLSEDEKLSVLKEGLSAEKGSYANELANKNIRNLSNLKANDIRLQVEANDEAFRNQDMSKIREGVYSQLRERGVTDEAQLNTLGEAITKIIVSEYSGATEDTELTRKERRAVKGSDVAMQIIQESSPGEIAQNKIKEASGLNRGDNTKWAENLNTQYIGSDMLTNDNAYKNDMSAPKENKGFGKPTASEFDKVSQDTAPYIEAIKNAEKPKYSTVSDDGKTFVFTDSGKSRNTEIKKVKSIDGRVITFDMEDGTTADSNHVSYGSARQAVVYESAISLGLDAATANAFAHVALSNPDVTVSDMKLAYMYGLTGQYNSASALDMNQSVKSLAYSWGQRTASENARKADAKNKRAGGFKKQDSAIFEDDDTRKKYESGKLNERQNRVIQAMNLFSKTTAFNYHVVESTLGEDGQHYAIIDGVRVSAESANGFFRVGTRDIYVDINAGANYEGFGLFTLAHETGHAIRDYNATQWKDLADAVVKMVDSEVLSGNLSFNALLQRKLSTYNEFRKERVEGYYGKSDAELYDMAYEDVVCDALSGLMDDQQTFVDFANEIKRRNEGLWSKIKSIFNDFIERIDKALGLYSGYSDTATDAYYKASKRARDRVRALYVAAFVNASENVSKNESVYAKMGYDNASEISNSKIRAEAENLSKDFTTPVAQSIRQSESIAERTVARAIELYGANDVRVSAVKDANAQIQELCKTIRENLYDKLDKNGMPLLPEETTLSNQIFDNGSYIFDAEPTTECYRQSIYRALAKKVTDIIQRPLSNKEAMIVNQAAIEIGIDAPCIYCYSLLDRKARENYKLQYVAERDMFLEQFAKDCKGNRDKFAKDYAKNKGKYYDMYMSRELDPSALNEDGKSTKSRGKDINWKKAARVDLWANLYIEFGEGAKDSVSLADIRSIDQEPVTMEEYKHIKNDRIRDLKVKELNDIIEWVQGASQAKKIVPYSAYTNEALYKSQKKGSLLNWNSSTIGKLNSAYGLRWYSHADFHPAFVIDNMQQIVDASVMGLKGLMYCKPIEAAQIYAPTGMNINVSCFAQYDAATDTYVNDDRLGADWEQVKALRDKYPNVGSVMVVTSDDMQLWALSQDWVDVVIPLHLVRAGHEFVREFGLQNYSAEQADRLTDKDLYDRFIADVTKSASDRVLRKAKSHYKSVYPSEHQNNYDKYVSELNKRGLTARFNNIREDAESGNLYYKDTKITPEMYMKLVNETRQPEGKTQFLQAKFDYDAANSAIMSLTEKGYFDYFKASSEWNGKTMSADDWAKQAAKDIEAGKSPRELGYGRTLATKTTGEMLDIYSSKQAKEYGYRGIHGSGDVLQSTRDIRYSLRVEYANGSSEEIYRPGDLSRSVVKEYIEKAKTRKLKDETYIPLGMYTPDVIVNSLRNAGIDAEAFSLIMPVYECRRILRENAKPNRGIYNTGHSYDANKIFSVLDGLHNPEKIVLQGNGRIAVFVEVNANGSESTSVIEFDSNIGNNMVDDDGESRFNVVVTMFDPDTIRNGVPFDYFEYLIKDRDGIEIEINEKGDESATNIGKTLPNVAETSPSFDNYSTTNFEIVNSNRGNGYNPTENEDIRYSSRESFESPEIGESVLYSIRTEEPPKNTLKGYKVFVVKNGKLYPPMVANPNGEDTPVGVWLNADVGAQAPDSKTGRKQVKAGGKGTQGGSGSLAFRPGWHLGEIPLATQFDRLNPATGKKELFPENFVWAECEIAADVDYQEEAMSYGYTKNGKFQHSLAGLPRLPVNGYYKYRTNPNPETVPWLITGAMKVERILSDDEVNSILESKGLPRKERQGGNKSLEELGLTQSGEARRSNRNYAPTFYSKMAKVVDGITTEKVGAQGVVPYLKGKGVKDEEIKWSGIVPFLEGKKSLTKSELQEFVNGSMLKIDEVSLDPKNRPMSDKKKKHLDAITAERDAHFENLKIKWNALFDEEFPLNEARVNLTEDVRRLLVDKGVAMTNESAAGKKRSEYNKKLNELIKKYDNFGYDNSFDAFKALYDDPLWYAENSDISSNEAAMLYKFEKIRDDAKAESNRVREKLKRAEEQLLSITEKADALSIEILDERTKFNSDNAKYNPIWESYKVKGGENYRELLFTIPNSTYTNDAMRAHWGLSIVKGEGVLAHARIDEVISSEGSLFFIEEIQSDWHNKGSKEGYTDKYMSQADTMIYAEKKDMEIIDKFAETTIGKNTIAKIENYYGWTRGEKKLSHILSVPFYPEVGLSRFKLSKGQREAILKLEHDRNIAFGENTANIRKVPDAPFRDGKYVEYVLKRLVRMAAEEGYENIGWTTAKQQSERWSDEFAEGYRIEYDQDIPKYLSKFGKQFGVSVGKTTLDTGDEVWYMPISESMTQSVLYEGQPLYSMRNQNIDSRDREADVLRAEIEGLKADLEYAKQMVKIQGKVTNGKVITRGSLEIVSKTIARNYGASGNISEFYELLNNFYGYLLDAGESATWESAMEQAAPAIEWLKANRKVKKTRSYESDQLLKEISKMRISLTKTQKAEVEYLYGSYNDYRKAMMGSAIISDNNATSLDSVWKELSSERPDLFDADMNEGDMPSVLLNTIQALRNDYEMDVFSDDAFMDNQTLSDIIDGMFDLKFLRTVADKYDAKIKELKAKHKAKLKEVRANRDAKIAEITKANAEYVSNLRTEYRNREDQIAKEYRAKRHEAVVGRASTEMKHKIVKVVNELNTLLLKGNKDKNVPISLQSTVASALDLLNVDSVGRGERIETLEEERQKAIAKGKTEQVAEIEQRIETLKAREQKFADKVSALKSAYEEFAKDNNQSPDPVITGRLDVLFSDLGDTPLYKMDYQQLEDVYKAYRMILTTVKQANKAFKTAKSESIAELGRSAIREIRSVSNEHIDVSKLSREFSRNGFSFLKPIYAMRLIGSDTLTGMFMNLQQAQGTYYHDAEDAKNYLREQRKKYDFKKFDLGKKYDFTSTSGEKFSVTLEQLMAIYAYSRREQAMDHLLKGGIVFDDNTEIDKNGKKRLLNSATAYILSTETLQSMINVVTSDANIKGYVESMQDYLSTVMGAKGNEVTRLMYGINLFNEKYYFPLRSSRKFIHDEMDVAGDVKVKNAGFTKETRAFANNPIVLSNFSDVWASHVVDMSMYHSFVLPLEDFNRVLNWEDHTPGDAEHPSVKSVLQNAYGIGAEKYLKNLINDLNGGARSAEGAAIVNKLVGAFKKGAVFASASVVIQQPSAIARAMAYIHPKYFVKTISFKDHTELWNEAKKYSATAGIKEMGYFDTGVGMSTVDWINQTEYDKNEMVKAFFTDSSFRDEVMSKAPSLADEITWTHIWRAVKAQVADETNLKVGSEEYLKECGRVFDETIELTQVYDSVLTRSGLMRSKDTGVKMATAFQAEPTVSFNMLIDSAIQATRQKRSGNAKAGVKFVGQVVGAVVGQTVLNALLKAIVMAWRDESKDDDKTYAENYVTRFKDDVIDGLNPLTLIPFAKDIVSLFQGYDVERADMALFSDLVNAINALDSQKKSVYRKTVDLIGAVSAFLGVPFKNIERDLRPIIAKLIKALSGKAI